MTGMDSQQATLTSLVDGAKSGNSECWEMLVDRMSNMVWSVVRGFRLSEPDAVDAAQMTWLRVVERLDQVREPERIGLWIATTARRECLRLIERSARATPVDPQEPDLVWHLPEQSDVADVTADRIAVQAVVDAMNTLSYDCQTILRLVLCQPPISYAEIAAALDIAVGTIGPRRQRCMHQLRVASGQ